MSIFSRFCAYLLTLVIGICLTVQFTPHANAQYSRAPFDKQILFELNSPTAVPANAETQVVIDAHRQWQFASSYFQSGQWIQSLTEYERFIYFFPHDPRIPLARYRMGLAQMEQNQIPQAMEQFQHVLTHTETTTDLTFKALFQIGTCLAERESPPQQAADHLARVAAMGDDPAIKAEALYRTGWLFLDRAELAEAQSYFERIDLDQRSQFKIDPLLGALADQYAIPHKNPKIAGSLALIPGSGYVYLQRYRDAWISFLLTGGLAWAAYEAFDNDSPVLGSLLGITGTGFYLGSIYGSVSSAHKANHRENRRFIDNLRQDYKVQLSLHPAQKTLGLMLTGRF